MATVKGNTAKRAKKRKRNISNSTANGNAVKSSLKEKEEEEEVKTEDKEGNNEEQEIKEGKMMAANGQEMSGRKKKRLMKKKKREMSRESKGDIQGGKKMKEDLQGVNGKEVKKEGNEKGDLEEEVNGEENKEEGKNKKKNKNRKKKKKGGGLQIEKVNGEDKKEEEDKEEKKMEGNNNEGQKKKIDDNTTTTTTTTLSPSLKRKMKKQGKTEQGNEETTDKEEEEEEKIDDTSPLKKMKIDSSESDKGGKAKKNKKRRKKKKGKGNQGGSEGMKEDDGEKMEIKNVDKKELGNTTNAGKKKNIANKPQENKTKEEGKTDETGKGEEKKGKKRRKKRKGKANQNENNAKKDDNKEEEEEEEEEDEAPPKKMKKEDQKTEEEENENGELENEAKLETADPILSTSKKRKLRKKKLKSLIKETAAAAEITLTTPPKATDTPATPPKTPATPPKTPPTPALAKTEQDSMVPILHSSCSSDDSKEKIKKGWQADASENVVEGDVEVIKTPFPSCYIKNLLENEQFLEGVKKELQDIPLVPKSNDLYKFQLTPDLKDVNTPYISALRDFLYKDMREWLQDVTGLTLEDTVDMSSSKYSHTDVLLCHDDVLEGRLIAYILYLVPPWIDKNGGTLDLFSCDDDGNPKDIVRSLVPQNNAFAFFQVTPKSFHQVSEIVSRTKTRLSINGWFHGPSVTRQQQQQKPLPSLPLLPPGHFEEEDFYSWINPIYLNTDTQKEIRKKFCDNSEVELENFLTDEAYKKLKTAMASCTAWQRIGPPNQRSYEVLSSDSAPQEVKECQQLLQCEAFFLVLSQLTGLKLHTMAPKDSDSDSEDENPDEPNPRCRVETQQWRHKSYTLLRDDCIDRHSALDAYLFANVDERWEADMGGHISYIVKDEDEELLTVLPKSNCLSLVYCDAQTLRFTKYINISSLNLTKKKARYHSFSCVYYE